METLAVPILKVKPYWRNPKKGNNIEELKASIQEFGFKFPILVDKDYTIISGHSRYRAMIELGAELIDINVAEDLTPAQVKKLRVIDNKISENNDWDMVNLQQELRELELDDLELYFGDMSFSDEGFRELERTTEEQINEAEERRTDIRNPIQTGDTVICPKCFHEFEYK